jgi:hypothetical protein
LAAAAYTTALDRLRHGEPLKLEAREKSILAELRRIELNSNQIGIGLLL